MTRTFWFPLLAVFLFLTGTLSAVLPDFVWNGTNSGDITLGTNWTGNVGPTGLGAIDENVSFGSTTNSTITVDSSLLSALGYVVTLHDITFTDSTNYIFNGTGSPTPALKFTGAFVTQAGNTVTFNNTLNLQLSSGSHMVNTASGSTVTVDSVVSGSGASIDKWGDGTLALNASNSFTGGVNLNGGRLLLGNSAAAGTGTLALGGGTLAPTTDLTLTNAVTLSGYVKLGDCNTNNAITFSGVISGSGSFDAHGYGDITFSGNNSSWTGGIKFYGANNVFVNHANGLGTGNVAFDSYSTTALHFNESATLSSLSGGNYAYVDVGEDQYEYQGSNVVIASGKTLTINQDDETNTTYSGKISGSGDGGLVKEGAGLLSLEGPVQISGPIAINAGTLRVDGNNEWQVQSGAVTVGNSGTLALSNSGSVNSNVTVASGGQLTGTGYVYNAIIQSGATLSPGTATCPIGQLDFSDLTLSGLSKVVIGIKSDGEGGLENSKIYVQNAQTLTLSGVDSTHKLTLKLISDDVLTNLTAGHTYQLRFLYFNNQTGGVLDASNVTIDPTGLNFESGFSANDYALSLYTSDGNYYFVNFTPVPEPSTYVLMLLGLTGTGFAAWRRRRQA
jgi:autotransporter-associated beta strand protein